MTIYEITSRTEKDEALEERGAQYTIYIPSKDNP